MTNDIQYSTIHHMRLGDLFWLWSSSPKDYYRYMYGTSIIVIRACGITSKYCWLVYEYENECEPQFLFEYIGNLNATFELLPPAWESIS